MTTFSVRLKSLRKDRGLTQQEVAGQIGIKQNSYSDWEVGKNEPSLENIVKLVQIFNTTTDYLITGRTDVIVLTRCELFGHRLRELRKQANLTQQEIADKIGVNRVTYTNWEKGNREPNFDYLVKLADMFQVTTDDLLGR